MKDFYIEITNNLLDPKHRNKMGISVWEFMWCLDKITLVDEEQIGWVLGKKPIQLKEIRKDIGITEQNISKNLNKLQRDGYITLKHTKYGIIISVNKAKKRFNQIVKPKKQGLTKTVNLNNEIDKPEVYRNQQTSIVDDKTVLIDKTVKTIAPASGAEGEVIPDLLQDKNKHIQIIGYFALAKKVEFESKKHQSVYIKRHTRAAADLSCYEIEKIKDVMRYLYLNADYKWELSTVSKYIDEDLVKLNNKKSKIGIV